MFGSGELGSEIHTYVKGGSGHGNSVQDFWWGELGSGDLGSKELGSEDLGSEEICQPRRHRPFRILSRYKEGGGGATPSAVSPLIELELREKKSV